MLDLPQIIKHCICLTSCRLSQAQPPSRLKECNNLPKEERARETDYPLYYLLAYPPTCPTVTVTTLPTHSTP